MSLDALTADARACRICAEILEPRPVFRLSSRSRILVIGQAPGSKVHASGVPWDDRSGERLVDWLGVDRATFDDPDAFGILPMGFCYPGKGKSGDKPPPPICAQTWHGRLIAELKDVRLTLFVGQYAQRGHLGAEAGKTLTETVRDWERFGPARFPLPHPSWRSGIWMSRNPWFEAEVVPALRKLVAEVLR